MARATPVFEHQMPAMILPARVGLLSSFGAIVAIAAACGGHSDDASQGKGDELVFIRAVQRLEQPDCIAKADPTESFLDRGSLDAALSPRYTAWFLIGNRVPIDPKDGGASIAKVSGAAVQIFDLSTPTPTPVATYAIDATGSADGASSSGDPGYGLASVEILPPAVVAPIRAELAANPAIATESYEARVALTGTFVDGRAFRTAQYVFVVDVCFGCSVTFPPDAIDPTVLPYPNCLRTGTPPPFPIPACLPGQDGPTDCRTCMGQAACTLCQIDANCPAGSRCGGNGVCRF